MTLPAHRVPHARTDQRPLGESVSGDASLQQIWVADPAIYRDGGLESVERIPNAGALEREVNRISVPASDDRGVHLREIGIGLARDTDIGPAILCIANAATAQALADVPRAASPKGRGQLGRLRLEACGRGAEGLGGLRRGRLDASRKSGNQGDHCKSSHLNLVSLGNQAHSFAHHSPDLVNTVTA